MKKLILLIVVLPLLFGFDTITTYTDSVDGTEIITESTKPNYLLIYEECEAYPCVIRPKAFTSIYEVMEFVNSLNAWQVIEIYHVGKRLK